MRIVSLQPSITVTLAGLGALRHVVACTKYCAAVCPEVADGKRPLVEDSWSADPDQIAALRPDLVIASVPYRLESLAKLLKAGVPVVALAPHTLADIYNDIRLLARVVDSYVAGEKLVSYLQDAIADTSEQVSGRPRIPVFSEEWGKPILTSQPWIAELIEASGGQFVGVPGEQASPEQIAAADPDVIIASWCGAGDRVPLDKIIENRNWGDLRAAKTRRVFCVEDELFNTPAHTLIGGLKAIRWALHPEIFERPAGIRRIGEQEPAK